MVWTMGTRIGFGWLACLMVLSSHRDIVGFYYILWPIRTKGSIVLAAQYTGCCRDGSLSLLLIPALLLRDPQNCTFIRKFLHLGQGCVLPCHPSGDSYLTVVTSALYSWFCLPTLKLLPQC